MATGNDRRDITPSLYKAIQEVFDQGLFDIYTALPASVTSYDRDKQLATIQPGPQVKYKEESSAKNRPLISNVPVIFPRAGKTHLFFPIEAGDEGLAVFNSRSIDQWIDRGGTYDPIDNRKFDYSDAVFFPGLSSQANSISPKGDRGSIELVNDRLFIELRANGKIKIKNDAIEFFTLIDALLTSLIGEPFIMNKSTLILLQTLLRQIAEIEQVPV